MLSQRGKGGLRGRYSSMTQRTAGSRAAGIGRIFAIVHGHCLPWFWSSSPPSLSLRFPICSRPGVCEKSILASHRRKRPFTHALFDFSHGPCFEVSRSEDCRFRYVVGNSFFLGKSSFGGPWWWVGGYFSW